MIPDSLHPLERVIWASAFARAVADPDSDAGVVADAAVERYRDVLQQRLLERAEKGGDL